MNSWRPSKPLAQSGGRARRQLLLRQRLDLQKRGILQIYLGCGASICREPAGEKFKTLQARQYPRRRNSLRDVERSTEEPMAMAVTNPVRGLQKEGVDHTAISTRSARRLVRQGKQRSRNRSRCRLSYPVTEREVVRHQPDLI